MEHYGVPGVGIAVIHDSKVAWFKTYGLADRETGEVAKNSTLFQAGSISKPVVAMINSNHPAFLREVVNAVGHAYDWDGYEVHDLLPTPEKMLSEYTGRYRYDALIPVTVTSKQGKLFLNYPGAEAEELIYTGDGILRTWLSSLTLSGA